LTPELQLTAIGEIARGLVQRQQRCLRDSDIEIEEKAQDLVAPASIARPRSTIPVESSGY